MRRRNRPSWSSRPSATAPRPMRKPLCNTCAIRVTSNLSQGASVVPDFVLCIVCPDRRGIVAEVSRVLVERDCNILDSQQFGARGNGRFFLRLHCLSEAGIPNERQEQKNAALA